MTAPLVWNTVAGPLTPDDPCMIGETCTHAEWLIWARLASAWINAAGKAARSDADMFRVNAIATSWQMVESDGRDCGLLECDQYVRVFVTLAQRARALVSEWGGAGVEPNNPWPDIIPGPGDLLPDVGDVVPWLLAGVGLVMLLGASK